MDKLAFISEHMDAIAVPYAFGEFAAPVVYPYTVGEISEFPTVTEDGFEESTLLLTCFHRGAYIELEKLKATIKAHFNPNFGLRGHTDSGSIAVFFDGAFYIPSGEAELKKMQINLKIKEWKGAK